MRNVTQRFRGLAPKLWHRHQTADVEVVLDSEDIPLGADVHTSIEIGALAAHHHSADHVSVLKWGTKGHTRNRLAPMKRSGG